MTLIFICFVIVCCLFCYSEWLHSKERQAHREEIKQLTDRIQAGSLQEYKKYEDKPIIKPAKGDEEEKKKPLFL